VSGCVYYVRIRKNSSENRIRVIGTYGRTLQNGASEFSVKLVFSTAAAAINFTCRALSQFAVC